MSKIAIKAARAAYMAKIKQPINTQFVLGRCVPSVKQNAAKIEVKVLQMDPRLKIFFEEKTDLYAHDPDKTVKTGDIVLVRQLPEKKTTLITHAVEKIVYRLGDVIDPITNKAVVADEYRDIIDERNELYGKVESAFVYEKAPPRGRLEGTLDLTDKPTYTKYYADCDDPYAW